VALRLAVAKLLQVALPLVSEAARVSAGSL